MKGTPAVLALLMCFAPAGCILDLTPAELPPPACDAGECGDAPADGDAGDGDAAPDGGDPDADDAGADDAGADDAGPDDTAGEEPPACPPDDETHIYITARGVVSPVLRGPVAGLHVAAMSPLQVMSSSPVPLAAGITGTGGEFEFACMDVADVALGLIILVDDNPADGAGGTYFPTGTLVASWTSDAEKGDVAGVKAFAATGSLVGSIGALGGFDAAAGGLVLGVVVDDPSDDPLEGAVVRGTEGGGSIPILYPNGTFTALVTGGATSWTGFFVARGPITLGTFTATLGGYSFGNHPGAAKSGYCYFLSIPGEPM